MQINTKVLKENYPKIKNWTQIKSLELISNTKVLIKK